jgi:hypothetical protein
MALADLKNTLNDTNEIEVTTTTRTSGLDSSRPVWLVTQGETTPAMRSAPVRRRRNAKDGARTPAVPGGQDP